mmetsp:Transcript_24836/g.29966  ORF Transcript_24836/g.29966 Transcript_24836/m.29966 type:complete len:110 (+) Transcript_24836:154-483(+)
MMADIRSVVSILLSVVSREDVVSVSMRGDPVLFAAGMWQDDVGIIGVEVVLMYGDDLWWGRLVSGDDAVVEGYFVDGNYGNIGFIQVNYVLVVEESEGDDENDGEGERS